MDDLFCYRQQMQSSRLIFSAFVHTFASVSVFQGKAANARPFECPNNGGR